MKKLEELLTENLQTLKRMAEMVGSPKEVLANMELEIQLMKNKDSRSLHLSLMHHKYAKRVFDRNFNFEEQDIYSLLAEITKAQRLMSEEKVPDDLLIDILNAALDKGIITTSKAAQLAGVNLMQFRMLSNKS